MAQIEKIVVQKVIAKIDEAETGSTPAGAATVPMNGAGDTVQGIHYGPGSAPMLGGSGGFSSMHGGSGTTPLSAGYNVVGGPDTEDAAPARPSKLELQDASRATAASLKAFGAGYVEPAGTVAGIGRLNERMKS